MATKISIIIPALNEELGIGSVIKEIPKSKLLENGYEIEIIVVDNGSTDNTAEIAKSHGARIVKHDARGYGNAYRAGFLNATGEIIVTGDADLTYPFDDIPNILLKFEKCNYEFLNTDRLSTLNPSSMTRLHLFGNKLLTISSRILFRTPFNDSQSGMWIFRRHILEKINVHSKGMSFSQEIKIEAHHQGFRCGEVKINYRARVGKTKLKPVKDSFGNISHMFMKRISIKKS